METISREELKEKMDRNEEMALIEVLSPGAYKKFHLPGAINVPIQNNFDEQIEEVVPDKDKQIVVYCMDKECEASPKAAQRLEELGYVNVYDYEEGKMDWKEAGLPIIEYRS